MHHFRILDVGLTLSGSAAVIGPIVHAYNRFEVERSGEDFVRFEVKSGDGESLDLRIDGAPAVLLPGLAPTQQVYRQVLGRLMQDIGSHALLHAGGLVDKQGHGFILAAPSGYGKSSMTIEMARRGFGFLGDDFVPLDLETRKIWPYPRTVSIFPDSAAPVPPELRALALAEDAVRLGGKSLIDIGQAFGDEIVVREPVPLRNVFLLSGRRDEDEDGDETSVIDLACPVAYKAEIDKRFERTDGVEVVARAENRGLAYWRIRLDHAQHPTERLRDVLESERILLLDKRWDARPDFSAPPTLTPVSRREAAECLGRELLNRRHGGRLMARYSDRLTDLFLDLAGALREARCWRVAVGGCHETADNIERLLAS